MGWVISQAGIASTTAGPSPPAVPTQFTTDSGVAVPVANNLNVFGSGSITSTGAGATVTHQLTGLTNHAVLIGAGTTTITKVGPVASTGAVLQSNGLGSDPGFSTATYPSVTTSQQILYSTAANTVGQLTTANSALAATNAAGTLAMRALSVVKQVITATGTYTPTTGMLYCVIECLGGGGAGGGSAATAAGTCSQGTGGGAGEYAFGVFSAATIGASQSVTIGAAGTGNSGAAGGNGGNTSVGALISANGGTGGTTPAAGAVTNAAGVLGGTGGSGGSFRTPGQPGSACLGVGTTGPQMSGQGGSTNYGSGGFGTPGTAAGSVALGRGAGGGGAASIAGAGAGTGGVGTAGLIIVTEFIIN